MFEFLLVLWTGLFVTILWVLKFIGSLLAIGAGMFIVGYPLGALLRMIFRWKKDYHRDGSVDWFETVTRQVFYGLMFAVVLFILVLILYNNGCNVVATCSL